MHNHEIMRIMIRKMMESGVEPKTIKEIIFNACTAITRREVEIAMRKLTWKNENLASKLTAEIEFN